MGYNNKINVYEENNISILLHKLREFRDQVDVTKDVSEVIDNLQNAVDLARKKQYEMEVISFFAFFSDHETINEQRRQLFFTTKMVYDDKIKELLKYYEESVQSNVIATSVSRSIEGRKNTGAIADLWQQWTNSFRKLRAIKRNNNV